MVSVLFPQTNEKYDVPLFEIAANCVSRLNNSEVLPPDPLADQSSQIFASKAAKELKLGGIAPHTLQALVGILAAGQASLPPEVAKKFKFFGGMRTILADGQTNHHRFDPDLPFEKKVLDKALHDATLPGSQNSYALIAAFPESTFDLPVAQMQQRLRDLREDMFDLSQWKAGTYRYPVDPRKVIDGQRREFPDTPEGQAKIRLLKSVADAYGIMKFMWETKKESTGRTPGKVQILIAEEAFALMEKGEMPGRYKDPPG